MSRSVLEWADRVSDGRSAIVDVPDPLGLRQEVIDCLACLEDGTALRPEWLQPATYKPRVPNPQVELWAQRLREDGALGDLLKIKNTDFALAALDAWAELDAKERLDE